MELQQQRSRCVRGFPASAAQWITRSGSPSTVLKSVRVRVICAGQWPRRWLLPEMCPHLVQLFTAAGQLVYQIEQFSTHFPPSLPSPHVLANKCTPSLNEKHFWVEVMFSGESQERGHASPSSSSLSRLGGCCCCW